MKFPIKKNETVVILAGKDRGKTGKVLAINAETNRVLVEGINVFKKHKRPTRQGQKGEVVNVSRSIHRSNVMHVDLAAKKKAFKSK